MDKKEIVNKTVAKLDDAKDIGERITPLVKEYQNKKSNPKEIDKLVGLLSEQFTVENSSEEKLRGILFTFRDNDFFHPSETQNKWHDLAEAWGVSKYFPHLINKTRMPSS